MRGTPHQDQKPTPIGARADKQRMVGNPAVELPTTVEPKSLGQQSVPPAQPTITSAAPTPPVESKPTAAEVKATAESLSSNAALNNAVPTGPKNNRVTPVVPIPTTIMARPGPQVTAATASVKPAGDPMNGQASAASLGDATQAAKAAVAVAMAKLHGSQHAADSNSKMSLNSTAMDNLTKKVNEMRVNATKTNSRGRGRGGRGGASSKFEVPDADFDFQAGNAKFNKDNLAKEAVAGPLAEASNTPTQAPELAQPEDTTPPVAYNKTTSFFDNISSESKDRAENNGQKPGGREWRGEEQRRNMETFGQGSVDGGYRGVYRGRGGRGRGRGAPRVRGFNRNPRGFYGQGQVSQAPQPPQ